ncbi:MAG: hypothetical protein ACLU3U_13840 [Gallintestinimicrobium sp.]
MEGQGQGREGQGQGLNLWDCVEDGKALLRSCCLCVEEGKAFRWSCCLCVEEGKAFRWSCCLCVEEGKAFRWSCCLCVEEWQNASPVVEDGSAAVAWWCRGVWMEQLGVLDGEGFDLCAGV